MENQKPLHNNIISYFPGMALVLIIGCVGKFMEPVFKNWIGFKIEYVLIAILAGLFIRNTTGVHRVFEKGINTYELWLKIGIVLLGSRFLFHDMLKFGSLSLTLVIGEVFFAIGLMLVLGRLFHLGGKLVSLLAIGSSICGVTAIIASKDAIDADNDDIIFAIAAILALGALGLFFYPVIGRFLGLSDHGVGLWIGLSIDNTAEALAAGKIYSEEAFRVATVAKTFRSAMLGFVVLAFALFWAAKGLAKNVRNKGLFVWQKFPKFVLGLLLLSVLSTSGIFNEGQIVSLTNLYKWFFLMAFAGIGLRLDFWEIVKKGFRPFFCGAIAETTITTFNLAVILAADKLIGF